MEYSKQAIVKRWYPILIEYEKIKNKERIRSFRFVIACLGLESFDVKEGIFIR